jgi:peptide/nickel transport system ATP-binding protein
MPLLSIKNLSIEFPGRYETDYAVEDVSFDLEPGEILGLVGESGAGKSTIGNGIVQLLSPPGRVSKGDIYLNDTKISTFTDKEILKVRGSRVGFIFQDPMTSLNPLFTVENQLVETITTNLGVGPKEASRIAVDLLDQVGIPDSEVRIKQFPAPARRYRDRARGRARIADRRRTNHRARRLGPGSDPVADSQALP